MKSSFVLMLLLAIGSAQPADAQEADLPQEEAERIAALEQLLSGSVFVGEFTLAGSDAPPTEERYEIISAAKSEEGDWWVLNARIQYGDVDMVLPIPLRILFSENTPVITIDSLTLPGLGTFDARVIVHDNLYAGTWRHDENRGHLFGRIERLEEE